MTNEILPEAAWAAAHKAHLAREKELVRLHDAVSAARRALPWLKVEKDYRFQSRTGPKSLADLFDGHSQLAVYHFMMAPGDPHRCVGCSFLCDHIDGANRHLAHHDLAIVAVARAPIEEIEPFRRRMGWGFEWVSSAGSDFNYDFQVSFTPEQIAEGRALYNFDQPATWPDLPGVSVFLRDGAGAIYNSFRVRGRGGEALIGAYDWLDLLPKGRQETINGNMTDWVRLHDEYPDHTAVRGASCCG